MSTTIEVSDRFHSVYKVWLKKMKLTSVQFMDNFEDKVKCRKQQVLYDSLPDPRQIRNKPLSKKKLHKNYRKRYV